MPCVAAGERLTEATEFARLVGQRDEDHGNKVDDDAGGHMGVDGPEPIAAAVGSKRCDAGSSVLAKILNSPILHTDGNVGDHTVVDGLEPTAAAVGSKRYLPCSQLFVSACVNLPELLVLPAIGSSIFMRLVLRKQDDLC